MNKKLNWDNTKLSIYGLEIDVNSINYIPKANNLQSIQQKLLSGINDEISGILQKALYKTALPPIKGVLTIGKLRWRGIRFCQTDGEMNKAFWLEQRGKRISPVVASKNDNNSFTFYIKEQ